jgi:hypothetical protein
MGEPDHQNPQLPDDPEFGYRKALAQRAYASLVPVWIVVGAVVVFAIWALVR